MTAPTTSSSYAPHATSSTQQFKVGECVEFGADIPSPVIPCAQGKLQIVGIFPANGSTSQDLANCETIPQFTQGSWTEEWQRTTTLCLTFIGL